ncbi:hypothetical protein C1I95_25805 [Micromonospora craterilacus]|uniref:Uncharacterized protein n=1 Tax=Micromonospora craterilacus TaxID=1655439 RepID=A0A2W2DKK0_9ACTN|nr:hypothetical protein [Micromonospora craterilacus]PZG12466.1 hypothetical protein C1I95_25805 [Micromonospora craterilacus]
MSRRRWRLVNGRRIPVTTAPAADFSAELVAERDYAAEERSGRREDRIAGLVSVAALAALTAGAWWAVNAAGWLGI